MAHATEYAEHRNRLRRPSFDWCNEPTEAFLALTSSSASTKPVIRIPKKVVRRGVRRRDRGQRPTATENPNTKPRLRRREARPMTPTSQPVSPSARQPVSPRLSLPHFFGRMTISTRRFFCWAATSPAGTRSLALPHPRVFRRAASSRSDSTSQFLTALARASLRVRL